jgi:hypothetical protein
VLLRTVPRGPQPTCCTVELKLETRKKALTIEAENALLAVPKIKLEDPEALITYVDVDEQDHGEDTIHLAGRARARQELLNLGEQSIDLTDPGDVILAGSSTNLAAASCSARSHSFRSCRWFRTAVHRMGPEPRGTPKGGVPSDLPVRYQLHVPIGMPSVAGRTRERTPSSTIRRPGTTRTTTGS